MGQKVNPISLRLGINRTWNSRWYLDGNSYVDALHEDIRLRKFLVEKLKAGGIARIIFERAAGTLRVFVHASRPGVIIGRRGNEIEVLTKQLSDMTKSQVSFNLVEVRKPELDAALVAESVAQQLERRVSFRRAMKRAVQSAQRLNAGGIRINCAGRLGGAEIARTEWYREGRVPLHTLRAYIDYGTAAAKTAYGICGVKVWIYKGELSEHDGLASDRAEANLQNVGARQVSADR